MKEKIKNLQQVLLEKTKYLRRSANLLSDEEVYTDSYGTPLKHRDKITYLKLSELSSYINALNWILGFTEKETKEEMDKFQKSSFLPRLFLKSSGDSIKRKPQEINIRISETLKEFIKKYQILPKQFEKAQKNDPRLLLDGDHLIFDYSVRELESIVFGELKALFWYLGMDKKYFDKNVKNKIINRSKIIDRFDIASILPDFEGF